MVKDQLGDRIKQYELFETQRRFMPLLPVYARLDGKNFSNFTRGLARPYDQRFSELMKLTTTYLVQQTNAVIGYTQSDEISLAWYSDKPDSQIFFDGKIFKMTSVLASMATAIFNQKLADFIPEKPDNLALFDCRVFQLPNQMETANAFLWRELDATKNAVSMAARTVFSHKQLQGKNVSQMQEMMWHQHGINFNDYPNFFKRGTFIQSRKTNRFLTQVELERIPPEYQPQNAIERTDYIQLDMPRFSQVTNRVDVIFQGADPICQNEME